MLNEIGISSFDQLIDETIPANIRLQKKLKLSDALTEYQYLDHIKKKAAKNKVYRNYIGLGYYNTITPSVIRRNILENPGWYTQYTPYQAEIAQGRLEALLNFQTMVSDLTGLEIANASLLDEGTAAAEAMIMFFHHKNKKDIAHNKFFVSEHCFPQTIDILKTKAEPLGIELIIGNHETVELNENYFGALLQYPAGNGNLFDYTDFISAAHGKNVYITLAADILALAIIKSPGELGADCAIGNTQRFGVPMGYGGPHAAYFATREEFKRVIPGRIIGVSVDRDNRPALRMALQTREQHIRREKATSNICTAQALLAIMAGMYAAYHGPNGIKTIAEKTHTLTCLLNDGLIKLGYEQTNITFFDTLHIKAGNLSGIIHQHAIAKHINFYYPTTTEIQITIDETTDVKDIKDILCVFAEAKGNMNGGSIELNSIHNISPKINAERITNYLTHPVFNLYHSESEMMR
ncbi:MAG: glycine dehydrogenase (aminomethyl-transferring), partial [Fimbriimonadaceae bacterium]|nr:glycine dehydrogenase (aminomethyl-transferring) [Chitinophagales bacterium]